MPHARQTRPPHQDCLFLEKSCVRRSGATDRVHLICVGFKRYASSKAHTGRRTRPTGRSFVRSGFSTHRPTARFQPTTGGGVGFASPICPLPSTHSFALTETKHLSGLAQPQQIQPIFRLPGDPGPVCTPGDEPGRGRAVTAAEPR